MKELIYSSDDVLMIFFSNAEKDKRLSSSHLSLYFALFGYWLHNNCHNPIYITRRAVMAKAKISVATYTKCIYNLHDYGYIKYSPSYHPAIGSAVFLNLESS